MSDRRKRVKYTIYHSADGTNTYTSYTGGKEVVFEESGGYLTITLPTNCINLEVCNRHSTLQLEYYVDSIREFVEPKQFIIGEYGDFKNFKILLKAGQEFYCRLWGWY